MKYAISFAANLLIGSARRIVELPFFFFLFSHVFISFLVKVPSIKSYYILVELRVFFVSRHVEKREISGSVGGKQIGEWQQEPITLEPR